MTRLQSPNLSYEECDENILSGLSGFLIGAWGKNRQNGEIKAI